MIAHTFSTRRVASSTPVETTVNIPTFDEATEDQKRNVWNRLTHASSATVATQARLKAAMMKGLRDPAKLADLAQQSFDAILNNTGKISTRTVADGQMFNEEQAAYLRSIGVAVS